MYSHCICLSKTGIRLFINQLGYIHSKPPIVMRRLWREIVFKMRTRFYKKILLGYFIYYDLLADVCIL